MMRTRFEEQLLQLNDNLVLMGSLIEEAILLTSDALMEQNIDKAKKAIEVDQKIDQMERDIEAQCLKLLLMQQPVARDLRLISAALKMITDMERIGDQAADIAEITIYLSDKPYIKALEHLPQMATATMQMVTYAIDAFVKRDLQAAHAVINMDDIVDDLFSTIKQELIGLVAKDASTGEQALDLLMVAKYYERIGDHAVNIAEWVEFAISGVHKGEAL